MIYYFEKEVKTVKKLSVIVPCYNESEVLPAFYDETIKVLDSMTNYQIELLFACLIDRRL